MRTASNRSAINKEAFVHHTLARDLPSSREQGSERSPAQPREVLSRLAGGIAHDFNNIVTIILGYSQLLVKQLGPCEELLQIIKASEQAAALTRQLLGIDCQKTCQSEVFDWSALVTEHAGMLQKLAGDDIELTIALAPNLAEIEALPAQITPILLQLAVSARDSLPSGGRLALEIYPSIPPPQADRPLTAGRRPNDSHSTPSVAGTRLEQSPALPAVCSLAQPCVMLVAHYTDSPLPLKGRLFEPVYPRNPVAKHHGPGLARIAEMVRELGGCLDVQSHLEKETTITICLPCAEKVVALATAPLASAAVQPADATLLLVEDHDVVRALLERILIEKGYRVLAAASGKEAVALAEQRAQPIDLLVTDVIMPRMNGWQLAAHLNERWPGLPVLFVSGLVTSVADSRHQGGDFAFLLKPFEPALLLQKVRELLGPKKIGTRDKEN
jgi:two-component system, cell cycle sensor histidine kinase and response regulator CckA